MPSLYVKDSPLLRVADSEDLAVLVIIVSQNNGRLSVVSPIKQAGLP